MLDKPLQAFTPKLEAFYFHDFANSYIPHILKEVYMDQIYAPFVKDKKDLIIADFGANIPEKTRTSPTKIAPTRKNKINHSLLIKTYVYSFCRAKLELFLFPVKILTIYKCDIYHFTS